MSHPLLTAPIGRSLLRLAGPTTALMVVQIFVAIAETWYVGRLGRDALAGLALVFPFMALMLNVANGGMGGGVASAMARALGAGRTEDARALVLHALVVGLAIGLGFTAFALTLAPSVYGLMGGKGNALAQALALSNLWFAGAAPAWVSSFFAALLRGSGDSATPARYGLLASLVYVPLSGVLALGGAGWSGFGIEGLAIASLVATTLALLLQARSLWRGRLGFTPRLIGIRLRGRLFGEILKVGIMGSVTSITGNLTAILVTGLIGSFGTAALAGYGIGVRLEYMVAPLAFGIGTGLTTLVGVAAGAEDWRRANKVAWIGGLISFATIGAIGWMVALLPEAWARLFTAEPQVIAASVAYITRVAPFYCLFGLGLTLYFASQGAGRMTTPLVASLVRQGIVTVCGWLAVERLGLGLHGVFAALAAGMFVYGCLIAGPLLIRPWRSRR
ncbi:MAG TPA: MATE family efflux transporter [Reyranella sp.]|nr:MATE family efflux transporter [Reyranella sp.]